MELFGFCKSASQHNLIAHLYWRSLIYIEHQPSNTFYHTNKQERKKNYSIPRCSPPQLLGESDFSRYSQTLFIESERSQMVKPFTTLWKYALYLLLPTTNTDYDWPKCLIDDNCSIPCWCLSPAKMRLMTKPCHDDIDKEAKPRWYWWPYLIFVTGTTGGACVKKMPGVNFYRFNAKNWQFTV